MSREIENKVLGQPRSGPFTRRQYLTIKALIAGADIWTAIEAVASVAIEHPEVDMGEERSWKEWGGDTDER